MAKQKERSDLELLRSEIRKLKSENRHLKKEISRNQKREHMHQILVDTEQERLLEEEHLSIDSSLVKCPECGKNTLKLLELGNIRRMLVCAACGHRKVTKK